MKLLNLGCGSHYHKDWINVDFISRADEVIAHNLLNGIPYKDNTFEVVYHSHLIEHFSKTDAVKFTKECYRVLKPNGIIRVAVPNLEEIINNYRKYLPLALNNKKGAEFKYDWTMIEMYDQCVRIFNGGELGQLYKKGGLPDPDFVYKRTGFKRLIDQRKNTDYYERKTISVLRNKVSGILHKALGISFNVNIKNDLLKMILGKEFKYYELGKFRSNGEVHLWMYDRFSLARLLRQNGFKDIKICKSSESRVPNWSSYNLDTNEDGTRYKPDSFYMEAVK